MGRIQTGPFVRPRKASILPFSADTVPLDKWLVVLHLQGLHSGFRSRRGLGARCVHALGPPVRCRAAVEGLRNRHLSERVRGGW